MRAVIKGLNYTEVITWKKDDPSGVQTIQFWKLKKQRKRKDVGIWKNGKLISATPDLLLKKSVDEVGV